MAFRGGGTNNSGGGAGTIAPGVPTKSIEIGDLFEQGVGTDYASKDHQHAFPGPAAGSAQPVSATGSDSDASDTAAARSRHSHPHTAAMHGPGGHADLSALFPSYAQADGRYSGLLHGAQHAPGGVDDLSGVFVPYGLVDSKGDLLVGNADNQLVRVPIGVDATVLQADAASPGGMKWGSPLAPTAETATTIKLRKALAPDGFEFYYGWSALTIDGTANTFTVPQQRYWVGGYPVEIQANTTVAITRPASGTRKDGIFARIDNANGGWSNPQYVFKAGSSGAFPSATQGDLSSPTGVYEVMMAQINNVPAGTTPTFADRRVIARGWDGGDQSGMMNIGTYNVFADAANQVIQLAFGATAFRAIRIVGTARAASGATDPRLTWIANGGVGTASYDLMSRVSSGTTTTTATTNNLANGTIGDIPFFNATPPYAMGNFETLIQDPFQTIGKKTLRSHMTRSVDDAPAMQECVSTWYDATNLSAITLALAAGNIGAGSYISVYGMK